MLHYELTPRFDSRTGKPTTPHMLPDYVICDYCGETVEEDSNVPWFKIIESEDTEQQYYEKEMPEGVDKHKLFDPDNPFNFCVDWSKRESCCGSMMQQAVREFSHNKGLDLFLWDVMYEARLNTVKRLLEAGMTVEELGIEED